MVKAIVFDMGGVVLIHKVEFLYNCLAEKLGVFPAELNAFRKEHYREMLSGEINAKKFGELVNKEFGINADVDAEWRKLYHKIMPPDEGMLELVKKLKKNYQVGMISDTMDVHYEINKERGLFDLFDAYVVSCKEGMVKPEKRFYDLILSKLEVKAEDSILIDDREKFMEPTTKMGFDVIHFTSQKKLEEDLKKRGIVF